MVATAVISIGRGSGASELGEGMWETFARSVRNVLALPEVGATVFVDGAESVGEWQGESEQSLTWVAQVDDGCRRLFQARLSLFAVLFDQDAIALTWGETELVEKM
jgi:hypothetical protein